MPISKILLIEDDKSITNLLAEALTTQQYQIDIATDGFTGLQLAQTYDYDLLLLDIVIPRLDGIRDDYVVKPFDLPELIARIKALLRRGTEFLPTILTWEQLQVNLDTCEVTYQDKLLRLSPKEYSLLEMFLRNPERIFTRSAILDRVWSMDEFPVEETVNSHIKGLRQRLRSAGMTENLIETVYGMGYRLKRFGDKGKGKQHNISQPNQDQTQSSLNPSPSAVNAVMEAIAQMRVEYLQSLPQKMALFEQAIAQLYIGRLDTDLHQQAQIIAHQLAGSLGTYGLSTGSRIARDIELLLKNQVTCQPKTAALQLQALIGLLQQSLHEETGSNLSPPSHLSQRNRQENAPVVGAKELEESSDLSSARLLIVDDDTAITERIKVEAALWCSHVEVSTNLIEARNLISSHPPDVILLDLLFPNTEENGLTLLSELTRQKLDIPVLIFTIHNDLRQRVDAARLGAYSFIDKTMPATEVLSAVKAALNRYATVEAKVMVIDDDPSVLVYVSTLLSPWGFQVTVLQESHRFLQVLEMTHPDLLILDAVMPNFNGFELCQVVRNDPRWSKLPVLFLSGHTDGEVLHKAYAVGVDDYLQKPIRERQLIERVLKRTRGKR
jgi:DNA-binding response OmpR family regulator/HPt (histidine-containing phosphotransfer) domain-containing protein